MGKLKFVNIHSTTQSRKKYQLSNFPIFQLLLLVMKTHFDVSVVFISLSDDEREPSSIIIVGLSLVMWSSCLTYTFCTRVNFWIRNSIFKSDIYV